MAKSIMIQGTMSNVGKSLITAGLCRIFMKRGYKTAPFKSQNMALNSYITIDGLEMGRAQAIQAEAAGIVPQAFMNPILLKPSSDTGSHVIVNGKSIGHMKGVEYFRYKKNLLPEVIKAYEKLNNEYDVIVIEGAGSPAEINLSQNDIVNMGMAEIAAAPVLLVGDIDRGGVFAQLYGTVKLLDKVQQDMIKGLIINKFRGDKTLLLPGLEMIEQKLSIPVLGSIAYSKLDIDDEDSLSGRLYSRDFRGIVDIVVIKFPRISNFSDFSPFERIEGVSLRYVDKAENIKQPDMIIFPQCNNPMEDMLFLKENFLLEKIFQLHNEGICIFGIGSGFQILGKSIKDSLHIVSDSEYIETLGLLPINTQLGAQQNLRQVQGNINNINGTLSELSGKKFKGYEMHMGINEADSNQPIINSANVYGSYIHGIFDESGIAKTVVSALARRSGANINIPTEINNWEYKEIQYNKLADLLEESLNMAKIFDIIDKGLN